MSFNCFKTYLFPKKAKIEISILDKGDVREITHKTIKDLTICLRNTKIQILKSLKEKLTEITIKVAVRDQTGYLPDNPASIKKITKKSVILEISDETSLEIKLDSIEQIEAYYWG